MADMGQLMHHHILDGLRGIGHQVQGEAEAVFPGAAAKSCPGGGDPDPGGPDAHDPGPIGYPLGQVSLGLPAKGLLLLRGGLRVLRPIPGLTLLLAADTIAKTVAATELPVSIFTSLLGVPFLLYLIIKPGRETR